MDEELLSELDKIVKEYCVCEREKSTTDEISINRTKEPLYKILLAKIINKEGQHEEEDLTLSLSCLLDNSPMSVGRYLGKSCSSAGVYEKVKTKKGTFIQYKK